MRASISANAAPKHEMLVKRRLNTRSGFLPVLSIRATRIKYAGISRTAAIALLVKAFFPISDIERVIP